MGSEIVSAVDYYNLIADDYDALMSGEHDKAVRLWIRQYFSGLQISGTILDFGCGSGLDISWLVEDKFKVIGCDLAESFLSKAKAMVDRDSLHHSVSFLGALQSDFRSWAIRRPAFHADHLLANFGVINYIPDLDTVFHAMAHVIPPGGNIFLNVFTPRETLLSKVRSVFTGRRQRWSSYQGKYHSIIIHDIASIVENSAEYFDKRLIHRFGNSDFTLVHLVRNEKVV